MQKLEYWKNKIKGIHFDDLPEFLKGRGFEKFNSHNSGDFAYKHNKYKVVVKHGYLCGNTRKPRKDAVPSIILRIKDQYYDEGYRILIQPLCNIKKYVRIKELDALIDKYPHRDVGKLNVGYYRNKLVMFDW